MALNVHKLGVAILTPEAVGSFGVRAEAILVSRIFHPKRSHGCCLILATEGSLPCGRYLIAKELIVLRFRQISTRFPTSVLHTTVYNTPLHSMPSL